MYKNIFVNATSATEGGSLTILNQFIGDIVKFKQKYQQYYIFVPMCFPIKEEENIIFVPIKGKKYIDRIAWDIFGMKRWSKLNNIIPDLIISLQNTAVRFGRVQQMIYLHTALPYEKEITWNLLKKDERKLWFYKNIYKIWIDWSIRKEHYIIVQTQWLKEALEFDGYRGDNIVIASPNIAYIDIEEVSTLTKIKEKKYLFYPAADYKYKNHKVIIDALINIRRSNPDLLKGMLVIFTLNKSSSVYDIVLRNNLQDNIIFTGKLEYTEVLSYYKASDLILFPSYIETFGLPLIEGMYFNKPILSADRRYSREVLTGYDNAKFIDYNDTFQWEKEIREHLVKKDVANITETSSIDNRNIHNYCGNKIIFELIKNICN